jgi:nickel/cobalt transporter (NicO) family protein
MILLHIRKSLMEIFFYLSLFALGALDALQPGHAKALVSSTLVGTNAKFKHVVILGIVVTLTHTIVNGSLAVLISYLAKGIFKENFLKYVELFTGSAIVLIAIYLIWQRFFDAPKKLCCHNAGHCEHSLAKNLTEIRFWQIVSLGIVSGLTPCPIVLTALISAIAVGKGFAAILGISVFSLGMGTVLLVVGSLTLYSMNQAFNSFLSKPIRVLRFSQACALIVLFLGLFLLVKSSFFYGGEEQGSMKLIFEKK